MGPEATPPRESAALTQDDAVLKCHRHAISTLSGPGFGACAEEEGNRLLSSGGGLTDIEVPKLRKGASVSASQHCSAVAQCSSCSRRLT